MSEAEFLLFFIPTMSIVISILIGMIVISDDEFAYIVRSIKYKTKNRYHCKNFRRNSCPYMIRMFIASVETIKKLNKKVIQLKHTIEIV